MYLCNKKMLQKSERLKLKKKILLLTYKNLFCNIQQHIVVYILVYVEVKKFHFSFLL